MSPFPPPSCIPLSANYFQGLGFPSNFLIELPQVGSLIVRKLRKYQARYNLRYKPHFRFETESQGSQVIFGTLSGPKHQLVHLPDALAKTGSRPTTEASEAVAGPDPVSRGTSLGRRAGRALRAKRFLGATIAYRFALDPNGAGRVTVGKEDRQTTTKANQTSVNVEP